MRSHLSGSVDTHVDVRFIYQLSEAYYWVHAAETRKIHNDV